MIFRSTAVLAVAALAVAAAFAVSIAEGASHAREFSLGSAGGLGPQRSPEDIVAGPGKSLWFAENLGNRIGRVTETGRLREYKLRPGTYPYGMAAGPDGNVWFTSDRGVGRIKPSGRHNIFKLPKHSGALQQITLGPDGALWFTESNPAKIGRITTAGKIRQFSLPAPREFLLGIAAGPDGALWVCDAGRLGSDRQGHGAAAVWRITTAGQLTRFAFPSGSQPAWLATGPDGALWVTENNRPAVVRLTIAGQRRTFRLPKASRPGRIVTGPDAALWFADPGRGSIGRIATDGATRKVSLPRGFAVPAGLAFAADGRLWYTDEFYDVIGHLGGIVR